MFFSIGASGGVAFFVGGLVRRRAVRAGFGRACQGGLSENPAAVDDRPGNPPVIVLGRHANRLGGADRLGLQHRIVGCQQGCQRAAAGRPLRQADTNTGIGRRCVRPDMHPAHMRQCGATDVARVLDVDVAQCNQDGICYRLAHRVATAHDFQQAAADIRHQAGCFLHAPLRVVTQLIDPQHRERIRSGEFVRHAQLGFIE
jgi:hypothetical protein